MLIKTKENYEDAINKKVVREFLFSFFKFKSIIGLAGPNFNDYILWCIAKGFSFDFLPTRAEMHKDHIKLFF